MPSTADPGWWKSPPDVVLPSLPIELWIEIFEFATHVPGALQSQSDNPLESLVPLPRKEELRSLKIAYRTKRSLVLVCKRWRDSALPILYRIVVADRTKGLMRLHRTMMFDLRSNEGVPCLRASVRRLVCITQGTSPPLGALAQILSSIPDLVIFNLWTAGYSGGMNLSIPKSLLSALVLCGQSLRVLDWAAGYHHEVALLEWRQMVSSLPSLKILRYGLSIELPSGVSFPPMQLPNLVSSSWGAFGHTRGRLTDEDDLRALQALEFCDNLLPVPAHISHNVTLLSVPASVDNVSEQVMELLSMFPNLVHLVMWAWEWPMWEWPVIPYALSLPRIRKLGLGRQNGQPCKNKDYAELFENLFSIEAPQLEVVRFVGWDEWRALVDRAPKVLSRFRDQARSRAFRVENREGKLLTDLWGLN